LQAVGRWGKCLDRRRANHADAWNGRHTLLGWVLANSLTISLSGQAGLSQGSNTREQHPTTTDHHDRGNKERRGLPVDLNARAGGVSRSIVGGIQGGPRGTAAEAADWKSVRWT
jgi:hypothetical protein